MSRPLAAGFLGAALLLAAACSSRETPPPTSPSAAATTTDVATTTPSATASATSTGPAEFEGSRALDLIDHLANTIGPRVAGSAGEDTAVAYIRSQFEASGYSVEIFPFTFEDSPYRPATVKAGSSTITGFAMSGSASGSRSGPAVFVGLADDAGIAGRDLSGKVAIADRGTLLFADKLRNVQAAGAVALLIINTESNDLIGNVGAPGDSMAIGIAGANADVMREAARSGATVTIETATSGPTPSVDVIARATPDSSCKIIVGGHHDTVPGTPGAHDNGSGAAETLELARAFAADGVDEGLCFVTFGAEESGLHGSEALAQRLQASGDLPRYMVNLDTVGKGTSIDFIGTQSLTSAALTIAQSLGFPAEITQLSANVGSDHMSFERVGVPVLFIATNDFSNIHTPADTTSSLTPKIVEQTGDLAYAFIKQLLERVARGEGPS